MGLFAEHETRELNKEINLSGVKKRSVQTGEELKSAGGLLADKKSFTGSSSCSLESI